MSRRDVHISRVHLNPFRDPIRVPRISNPVPRIIENYHRVPKIRENRVTRIREIGSLQIHTRFLTLSLKKLILATFLFQHNFFVVTNYNCFVFIGTETDLTEKFQ